MKNIITKVTLMFTVAVAMIFIGNTQASAKTLVVDKNLTNCRTADFGPFATITGALSATAPGDTIYVCPATYPEQLTFSIPNITVIGTSTANNSLIEIVPPAGGLAATGNDSTGFPIAPLVKITANNVVFGNFLVNGANSQIAGCTPDVVGIFSFNTTGGFIFNNTVKNITLGEGLEGCQSGQAIFVDSSTSAAKTTNVLNNVVENFQKTGILVIGNGNTSLIRGNFIAGLGATPNIAQNGIQVSGGATGDLFNNRINDMIYSQCTSEECTFNSAGIIIFEPGANLTVRFNKINTTQNAILGAFISSATFNNNEIFNSQVFDGIYLFDSNFNTIRQNQIYASDRAGVYLDGNSTGNTVTQNFIEDAPVGISDNGISTSVSSNTFISVGQNVGQDVPDEPTPTLQGADRKVFSPARANR